MTMLNNVLKGQNFPVADHYFRGLHDFRAGLEVSLLPLLNYFIAQTEGSSDSSVISFPSEYFANEEQFLSLLAHRYYKRGLTCSHQAGYQDPLYRILANLVRHTRKIINYSLNDLSDLLHYTQDLLVDIHLHENLLAVTKIATKDFYKQTPASFKKAYAQAKVPTIKSKTTFARAADVKFADSFQLYAYLLSGIKRVIDFEALKLYDFLLETSASVVRSNALLGIIDEIKELGETEYAKIAFVKTVVPGDERLHPSEDNKEHIFLEEWSSNVRRALELKHLLALDLTRYLHNDASQEQRAFVQKGCYPELSMLLRSIC